MQTVSQGADHLAGGFRQPGEARSGGSASCGVCRVSRIRRLSSRDACPGRCRGESGGRSLVLHPGKGTAHVENTDDCPSGTGEKLRSGAGRPAPTRFLHPAAPARYIWRNPPRRRTPPAKPSTADHRSTCPLDGRNERRTPGNLFNAVTP